MLGRHLLETVNNMNISCWLEVSAWLARQLIMLYVEAKNCCSGIGIAVYSTRRGCVGVQTSCVKVSMYVYQY